MDEFGSPIAGGITAVRRNVSSSFFGAPRTQQAEPDPVTTNLLQQQSLAITNVSSQLETITQTLTSLNFSLNSIRQNLAISDTITRQREAAKQKREAILAEQGLREGKESALEAKIQNALVSPVQRVAQKTQGVLSRLFESFLFLAGGWLTATGIDLIQALVEGNGEKIRRVGAIFTGGLVLIGGTITAVTIGLKKTLGLLTKFTLSLGKVAFGGALKIALLGVKKLLAVAAKAVLGGAVAGGISGAVVAGGAAGGGIVGTFGLILDRFVNKGRSVISRFLKFFTKPIFKKILRLDKTGKQLITGVEQTTKGKQLFKNVFKNPFKKAGAEAVEEGGKKVLKETSKKIVKQGAKKGFLSIFKAGAKKLFSKLGGPFVTFIIELISGEGIGAALSAAAGFAAGAKVGAAIGAAIGAFFGGIGAGPGALIGGFIGGVIGESAMKRLYKGIKNMFFPPKELSEDDFEAVTIDEVELAESGNIVPLARTNNEEIAKEISNTDALEGQPTVINVPADVTGGGDGAVNGNAQNSSNDSQTLPSIPFDEANPHTLFATATTGVSD